MYDGTRRPFADAANENETLKTKTFRALADLAAAAYIAFCFLRQRGRPAGAPQTVIFSRGAFRRDISSIGSGVFLVVVRGEWLRRFFRAGVPDGWLEQGICLSYRPELRAAFPLSFHAFRYFVNRTPSRIVFGGVDYFEVTIFAEHAFYRGGTAIEAIFHENYAIGFVRNVNLAFYRTLQHGFLFDRLFTYGPPATTILRKYTAEATGPRRMVMPRLASMEDDEAFAARLPGIDASSFGATVLLLAFPGAEYLAPLCFTSTVLELARLGAGGGVTPIIKFKNAGAAKPARRQCAPLDRHIRWVTDGSVEELVWQAGFTVVFNSIAFYEALLGPTLVIIPSYLDSQHDENMLQETPESITGLCGELQSVRFAHTPGEITEIMASMRAQPIAALAARERAQRKALVARKFYLKLDLPQLQPEAAAA
jgi:hypothetical protein